MLVDYISNDGNSDLKLISEGSIFNNKQGDTFENIYGKNVYIQSLNGVLGEIENYLHISTPLGILTAIGSDNHINEIVRIPENQLKYYFFTGDHLMPYYGPDILDFTGKSLYVKVQTNDGTSHCDIYQPTNSPIIAEDVYFESLYGKIYIHDIKTNTGDNNYEGSITAIAPNGPIVINSTNDVENKLNIKQISTNKIIRFGIPIRYNRYSGI